MFCTPPETTLRAPPARYKQYYSVMAGQATMLAGFGFSALTSDIPPSTHIAAEVLYMVPPVDSLNTRPHFAV